MTSDIKDKGKLEAALTLVDDDLEEVMNLLQEVDSQLDDANAHTIIEKMEVVLEMLSEYDYALNVLLGKEDDDPLRGDEDD